MNCKRHHLLIKNNNNDLSYKKHCIAIRLRGDKVQSAQLPLTRPTDKNGRELNIAMNDVVVFVQKFENQLVRE
jgi:hypothetical protein